MTSFKYDTYRLRRILRARLRPGKNSRVPVIRLSELTARRERKVIPVQQLGLSTGKVIVVRRVVKRKIPVRYIT